MKRGVEWRAESTVTQMSSGRRRARREDRGTVAVRRNTSVRGESRYGYTGGPAPARLLFSACDVNGPRR